MTHLTLTYPAAALQATDSPDQPTRQVAGIALPYGVTGRTSAGPVRVQAGAVQLPGDLRRVKLTRDHDRNQPVGFLAAADDTAEGLHLSFTMPRGVPSSDAAFLEASEGLRDGLSVELDDLIMAGDLITSARLVAVSQVAVPAFADAGITQLAAAAAPAPQAHGEGTNMPEETTPATVTAESAPAQVSAQLGTTPAAPQLTAASQWEQASQAIMRQDTAALQAALSDATTVQLGATVQPQWLGELWTEDAAQRPMIDASSTRPLSGLKVQWLEWTQRMAVAPWAGDKTAVPSTVPVAALRERSPSKLAGGVDVARELVDLGSPALLRDIMQQAVNDYRNKSEAAHAAAVLAAATVLGDATDALDALIRVAAQVLLRGQVTSVFLGQDAWVDLAQSGASLDFLTGSINLATGTGTAGAVSFRPHAGLAPRQVLGFDRRAVTFQELNPPVQVNAVNVALGGLDEALHGYHLSIVNSPAAVAQASY